MSISPSGCESLWWGVSHTGSRSPFSMIPRVLLHEPQVLHVVLDPETPRSSSSLTLNVLRARLSTVDDRAFPVAAACTWKSLPQHVTFHLLCLFSEVTLRRFSSGVHSHDFYRNFCRACTVTVVIFGHFNCSFLLTWRRRSICFSVDSIVHECLPQVLAWHSRPLLAVVYVLTLCVIYVVYTKS